jgi:hypothetical protein
MEHGFKRKGKLNFFRFNIFEFLSFDIVSDFGFRASNF